MGIEHTKGGESARSLDQQLELCMRMCRIFSSVSLLGIPVHSAYYNSSRMTAHRSST